MPQTALITGITGQDGSYLCELLLSKGYCVHGSTRSAESESLNHLKAGLNKARPIEDPLDSVLKIHELDFATKESISEFLDKHKIDEIYHLAGQTRVGDSFDRPTATFNANVKSTLSLLEAIRTSSRSQSIRFFQASSAEIFGGAEESPQTELTRYAPRSPYAASKVAAQSLVESYREAYGLFVCSGILYNHESPRRSTEFVTGKIVDAAARIALGEEHKLVLGNLETGRDWGFAGDYVEAMWMMLQHEVPKDFVIATGEWHSLREFLEIAFQTVGLDWQDYTTSDPKFFRPVEPTRLVGDPTRIKTELGWQPATTFVEMIEEMVKQRIVQRRNESEKNRISPHT